MSDGGRGFWDGQPEALGGGESDLSWHRQVLREDAGRKGLGELLAVMPEGLEGDVENRAQPPADEELLDKV